MGAKNEKPAFLSEYGFFLASLGPYGEGHTTGPMPKLAARPRKSVKRFSGKGRAPLTKSGAEFSDQGSGIGVDLDQPRPAKPAHHPHHIMTADEEGLAQAAQMMEAQGAQHAFAVDNAPVPLTTKFPHVMAQDLAVIAVPGRGAGGAEAG